MKPKIYITVLSLLIFLDLSCASAGSGQTKQTFNECNPQIERGKPNIIVDSLGNIISLPQKIILLNFKIGNHSISPKTEQIIGKYIKDNPQILKDTKIRLNQFSLFGDLRRLAKNKKISWYWRILPGIPVTILSSLTGRLLGGDNYNPYADTVSIYSDIPAVALHELGHAVDTAERVEEGWADYYALGRIFPPLTLYQEYVASQKALDYLSDKNEGEEEKDAYRVLIPAYGTYAGGYSGLPYGDVIGAGVGHVVSIVPRYNCELEYQAIDSARWSNEIVRNIESDPLAKNLIEEGKKNEEELNKLLLFENKDSQAKLSASFL